MGRSGEICASSARADVLGPSGNRMRVAEPGLDAVNTPVSFLLCNSCYWCATEIGGVGIRKCPSCRLAVEPLPIAADELFRFGYDRKSGVHLAFRRG